MSNLFMFYTVRVMVFSATFNNIISYTEEIDLIYMSVYSSKIALRDDNNLRTCLVRNYLDPEELLNDMLNLNLSYFSARSITFQNI
jgi:hypothetical protein